MNESPYFVAFYKDMKARRLIWEFMLKIRKILKLTDSGERVLGVCSTIVGCKKFLTHCFAHGPSVWVTARWERKCGKIVLRLLAAMLITLPSCEKRMIHITSPSKLARPNGSRIKKGSA